MMRKKCAGCSKKVLKSYSYCPFCGSSFKQRKESEDYGMLGRDDDLKEFRQEIGLPLGMGKIVNTLVKQLEKELGSIDFGGNGSKTPKGFKIQVSTGRPNQNRQVVKKEGPEKKNFQKIVISKEEFERRKGLPKKESESKVRRLSDRIIYEISVPGVFSKKDVVITRLASGFEVKAYSKKNCYYKFISLDSEFLDYFVEDEKVFVELKA